MSDIIHLLPDSVANQIAAGEVIQRPASVIKELVENAVDASATRIDVVVEDAGKTSIQVVDNGKGMSETDARLSFERKTCIGLRHPLPVVHYLNRSLARIFHHHVNPCSRSVYGILHQFFYHRSRPLYHFTGGNLVCHRIRQQMYNIAHLSEYA